MKMYQHAFLEHFFFLFLRNNFTVSKYNQPDILYRRTKICLQVGEHFRITAETNHHVKI